jgi:hypothetical protein
VVGTMPGSLVVAGRAKALIAATAAIAAEVVAATDSEAAQVELAELDEPMSWTASAPVAAKSSAVAGFASEQQALRGSVGKQSLLEIQFEMLVSI